MSVPLLQLEAVFKTFDGGIEALKPVSLSVEAGEFVAILGPSGAGKSTLLRVINRLVEPTGGTIYLEGEEVTGASAAGLRRIRHRIGMIFQEFNLIDRASVLTNVLSGCLGSTPSHWAWGNRFRGEDRERAFSLLERMGLKDHWNQRADRLSGGQRQRVGIARALMQEPALLLADEPVASLDPASARSIVQSLRDINRQDGVTVICNLHQPELARACAGRVLGLRAGRAVYDGPPEGLEDSTLESIYQTPAPA